MLGLMLANRRNRLSNFVIILSGEATASERLRKVQPKTVKSRRWLATFLVALFAICVLAPPVALALVCTTNAIHCSTENGKSPHPLAASTDVQGDCAAHESGNVPDSKDDNGAQIVCCGLFSVSAIAAGAPAALHVPPPTGGMIAVLPHSDLADHPPGRLIRPPII